MHSKQRHSLLSLFTHKSSSRVNFTHALALSSAKLSSKAPCCAANGSRRRLQSCQLSFELRCVRLVEWDFCCCQQCWKCYTSRARNACASQDICSTNGDRKAPLKPQVTRKQIEKSTKLCKDNDNLSVLTKVWVKCKVCEQLFLQLDLRNWSAGEAWRNPERGETRHLLVYKVWSESDWNRKSLTHIVVCVALLTWVTPYLACFLPFCTSFCTFQLTPSSVSFVFRLHFSSITGSSFYPRPPQPFYLSICLSIYTVYYLISYLIRFACIELFALYFRLFRLSSSRRLFR